MAGAAVYLFFVAIRFHEMNEIPIRVSFDRQAGRLKTSFLLKHIPFLSEQMVYHVARGKLYENNPDHRNLYATHMTVAADLNSLIQTIKDLNKEEPLLSGEFARAKARYEKHHRLRQAA